jgi:hypothetical protein
MYLDTGADLAPKKRMWKFKLTGYPLVNKQFAIENDHL